MDWLNHRSKLCHQPCLILCKAGAWVLQLCNDSLLKIVVLFPQCQQLAKLLLLLFLSPKKGSAKYWDDHLLQGRLQILSLLSLAMVKNIIDEVNEVKMELEIFTRFHNSPFEVISQERALFLRFCFAEDPCLAVRNGILGARINNGLQHSIKFLQIHLHIGCLIL